MALATPTTKLPSHSITLSDGSTTIGLIAVDAQGHPSVRGITRTPYRRSSLKMSAGGTRYSDFEPPYTPIEQRDWSGGRGQLDFTRDSTKFYDSLNCWTLNEGQVTSAPQWSFGKGYRNADFTMPGSVQWSALTGAGRYLATSFSASASYTTGKILLWLRTIGTPNDTITVELCSDSAGSPGTVLKSATLAVANADVVSNVYEFSIAQAITSGTTYWVKVYATSGSDTSTNGWEVAHTNDSRTSKKSSNNSDWNASTLDLYFRVTDADTLSRWLFYEYKRGLYAVQNPDGGGTPKVWINGDRGAADSNSADKSLLNDATKSWTTDEWAGNVALIVAGPGKGEYRTISSNTGTALTVSPDWDTTHTTSTDYVILGSAKWTEQTGHGLTATVTDVAVLDDIIYYAQGDDTAIRRHREYNNAGTWTATDWAADGTNNAVHLLAARDPISGPLMWRSENDDSSNNVSISRATNGGTWGTDLSFGSSIRIGTNDGDITNLHWHDGLLWVFKEDGIFPVQNDVPDEMLPELREAMSLVNGAAATTLQPFMFFAFGHYLNRLYARTMDTLFPGGRNGFPDNRQGYIAAMEAVPRFLICGLDGGTANYSAVLVYENGWHEIFRTWTTNRSISALNRIVVPGDVNHQLWIGAGSDLIYMPWPEQAFNPLLDTDMTYQHEWNLITSWIDAGLSDLNKFFNELKLVMEGVAVATTTEIRVEYQTDDTNPLKILSDQDTGTWNTLATFTSAPVQTKSFSSDDSVGGKRVRLRFRGLTGSNTLPATLKASVLEMVARIPVKFIHSLRFKLADATMDLQGKPDTDPATVISQLKTWAEQATPVTLRSQLDWMDNRKVFVDPVTLQPDFRQAASDRNRAIAQLNLLDA